jgi:hypothetical protein
MNHVTRCIALIASFAGLLFLQGCHVTVDNTPLPVVVQNFPTATGGSPGSQIENAILEIYAVNGVDLGNGMGGGFAYYTAQWTGPKLTGKIDSIPQKDRLSFSTYMNRLFELTAAENWEVIQMDMDKMQPNNNPRQSGHFLLRRTSTR